MSRRIFWTTTTPSRGDQNRQARAGFYETGRPFCARSIAKVTAADGWPMCRYGHECLWISYFPIAAVGVEVEHLGLFNLHHRLAVPVAPWAREAILNAHRTPHATHSISG